MSSTSLPAYTGVAHTNDATPTTRSLPRRRDTCSHASLSRPPWWSPWPARHSRSRRSPFPQPSPAASVSQRVGITDITVTYHRPAVNKRDVWGTLVPRGQVWRAGANENTVITFSTEVSVGGHVLPAGSYGLHMIPAENDWTVIFSKEARAWGSFFYDEKDDAARVTVTPQPSGLRGAARVHVRRADRSQRRRDAALGEARRPVRIDVNTPAVVAASLRTELRGLAGFTWQGFAQAASWCARNDVNLDEAQTWADRAIAMNENFQTLRARALVAEKKGDAPMAQQLRDKSLTLATEADMNGYGYTLLQAGKIGRGDRGVPAERREVPGLLEHVRQPRRRTGAGRQEGGGRQQLPEGARRWSRDETNQKRIDGILSGLGAGPRRAPSRLHEGTSAWWSAPEGARPLLIGPVSAVRRRCCPPGG